MMAAVEGHHECVSILIAHGAVVNAVLSVSACDRVWNAYEFG